MKITNHFKLPYSFYKVACDMVRPMVDGEMHVTTAISPPQVVALQRKHWNELEQDCSDLVWAIFGSAVHSIMEKIKTEKREVFIEQKLEMQFDKYKLVGTPDVYTDKSEDAMGVNCITDWKTAGLYVYKNGIKPEWVAQLNIYKAMFENLHPDFSAQRLEIVVFFKDWTKSASRRIDNYPNWAGQTYNAPIWDKKYTLDYINTILNEHKEAENGNIRPCTDEETWHQGDAYKVYKGKNVRCVNGGTFDNGAEAIEMARALGMQDEKNKYRVEKHMGTRNRCQDNWCLVNKYCPQYLEMYPRGLNFGVVTNTEEIPI